MTSTETAEVAYGWNTATPGRHLPPHDGWPCGTLGTADLACTRQDGHSGQHVATACREVLAVWPNP